MKDITIILLCGVMTVFSSCNGQTTSEKTNDTLSRQTAIGDTVSEISKSIWSIFQDRNNNYWFGSSDKGVFRYDGKTVIQFTGLWHNKVRRIQEDKAGNLYFTTDSGINKFDGRTFSTLPVTESNDWKLQPDDLWFQGGQDEGLVYRYDGHTLHRLKFPATKPGDAFIAKYPRAKNPFMTFSPYDVYSIYKDSQGNIWFGTSSLGACRYNGKSFTWIDQGLSASPVRSVIEDKDGRMWFGNSGQGIYRYDGKSLTDYRKEKGIGNVTGAPKDAPVSYNAVTKDNSDALWIATYRFGIWKYDEEKATYYPIEGSTPGGESTTIYRDNRGVIWVGTHNAGVYKFNGNGFEKWRL